MSTKSKRASSHAPTSSASASPAKTSAQLADELASLALEAFSSTDALTSLRQSIPTGSSSRMSPAVPPTGSTLAGESWDSAAMRRARSRFARQTQALCTSEPASSLLPTPTVQGSRNALSPDMQKWPAHRRLLARTGKSLLPTLTATRYGSTNNGSPRDHREAYATKGTPSLDSLAGACLNPSWCEWFMGFPPGWTEPGAEHADLPLFRILPKS